MTTETATAASSLATWLRRQGQDVSFIVPEGSMGASEVLGSLLAGTAALRAFMVIAREWIRAHRTKITLEIEGRGSLVVEGTTDIDQLIRLLEDEDPENDVA